MNFDMDPQQLVAKVAVIAVLLIVAFPVHEFAHAFAAYRLGDSTARYQGRLTLDPGAHFDRQGGLLLIISVLLTNYGFGWAKPTPYNPFNLRGGRTGEALVAAAGPISNLIMAILASIPLRVMDASGLRVDFIEFVLYYFVAINLSLMVFNLIPIPPLDGSKVLYAFLDRRTEMQVRPFLEQYGIFILIAAMFFPLFGGNSLIDIVFRQFLGPLLFLLTGR
jgi:Zn-dependent protease